MNEALIALLVCHYLADFYFSSPAMIRAKAYEQNVWPILLHASVHALLMGLFLLLWGVALKLLLWLMLVEFVSHFLLDTGKGRLTACYSTLADQQKKSYWMLCGFDQLLHMLVIVGFWCYARFL